MAVLVVAAHDNINLNQQTLRTVTAAALVGGEIDVLVAGHDCAGAAQQAARIAGVRRVLLSDAPYYADDLAEPLADLISAQAPNYEAVLGPATSTIKNVMPRVAALLDVAQVSEVTAIRSATAFERPIYAGNAIQHVDTTDRIKVMTVRASSFEPAAMGGAASVDILEPKADPMLSALVRTIRAESGRPELSSARIIVSGGRGLGSKENFEKLVLPLADRLGAAVGASRAAVDAGYAPNDWQVGQTGKIVSPDLYIAIGISGAIQHLAGMKEARAIVAINSDASAPIFKIADYGLVGDLFKIVPDFLSALER
jgi:electron transfer flavoprotein alpha subunit